MLALADGAESKAVEGEGAVPADLLRGLVHARSPMPNYAARLQLRDGRIRIIAATVTDPGRGVRVHLLEDELPHAPGVVLRLLDASAVPVIVHADGRRVRGRGSAITRVAACALLTATAVVAVAVAGHGVNGWRKWVDSRK